MRGKKLLVAAALTAVSTIAGVVGLPAVSPAGAAGTRVGTTPADYTPWLSADTPNQYVRYLRPCGKLMYAVGRISDVQQGSGGDAAPHYHRYNAFSFSMTTGAVTNWAPRFNGEVRSIVFGPKCGTAYLGGSFTKVNGVRARHIVALNARTGQIRSGFRHAANAEVDTLQFSHGQILAGGRFTRINGAKRVLFASLNPRTGAATKYARFQIAGYYANTMPVIWNSQRSNAGSRMLIEGVFTSINGKPRQQIAMLNLGRKHASLNGWTSREFRRACRVQESFYVRSAAWGPNDGTVYIATTGGRPAKGPGSRVGEPRAGLCDAAAAFPAAAHRVSHRWVNYTGCDSLYGIAADNRDVYVTGHERWANNSNACNQSKPPAVNRPGVGSINPRTGMATPWNPTRSLGHGGDAMRLTSGGLWIGSDNFTNGLAQMCGGQDHHGGICYFPY